MIISFLVIAGYGTYYYSAYTIRNEVLDFAHISAQQINKNIDTYIDELFRLSAMTFSDEELQRILKNSKKEKTAVEQVKDGSYIMSFLFNIYSFRPDLYSVCLITNTGEIYTEGFNRYINNFYDVKKEGWYSKLEENPKKILIIGPRISFQTMGENKERHVFTIVRKIVNSEGQMLGTVILDTKYETFRNIFIKLEKDQKAQIILLNENKKVMYNSREDQVDQNKWIESTSQGYDTSFKSGQFFKVSINNENNLAIIDRSDYTGWDVIMAVPEVQLFGKINHLRNFIIVLILLCICVSVFVYIFIASAVTSPVRKLTSLMKSVENGDFSVSMHIESDDEIGELGRGFNNMISRINLLLKKMVESEVRKKEAEYKALQSQINPHFLYNTLESIRMKCIVKRELEIAEVISTLGNLFRLSIDRGENFVTVRDELEHVHSYMSIQNFRFDDKYKLYIDVDKELMDYKLFKLMLQPLVENSIYHGLEMKPEEGYIRIKIVLESGILHILIEDNGMGMDQATYEALEMTLSNNLEPKDRRSVGLRNVHERIRLLFGKDFGICLWSKENEGTKIKISIPAFKDINEVKFNV